MTKMIFTILVFVTVAIAGSYYEMTMSFCDSMTNVLKPYGDNPYAVAAREQIETVRYAVDNLAMAMVTRNKELISAVTKRTNDCIVRKMADAKKLSETANSEGYYLLAAEIEECYITYFAYSAALSYKANLNK